MEFPFTHDCLEAGPGFGSRLYDCILNAAEGNLKKVTLKLGGKSPSLVLSDADLENGIPGAASAIFFNHGQCGCAGSRLYVEKSIFDKVVAGVENQAKQITLVPGMNPSTQMAPRFC